MKNPFRRAQEPKAPSVLVDRTLLPKVTLGEATYDLSQAEAAAPLGRGWLFYFANGAISVFVESAKLPVGVLAQLEAQQ